MMDEKQIEKLQSHSNKFIFEIRFKTTKPSLDASFYGGIE